jgi:hypothetical protein
MPSISPAEVKVKTPPRNTLEEAIRSVQTELEQKQSNGLFSPARLARSAQILRNAYSRQEQKKLKTMSSQDYQDARNKALDAL